MDYKNLSLINLHSQSLFTESCKTTWENIEIQSIIKELDNSINKVLTSVVTKFSLSSSSQVSRMVQVLFTKPHDRHITNYDVLAPPY